MLHERPGGEGSPEQFVLLDGPAYIHDPGPTGFVCHVPVFSLFNRLDFDSKFTELASKRWGVTWLGIED